MEGSSEENSESGPPPGKIVRQSGEELMWHACANVVQEYLKLLNERPGEASVFTVGDKVYEARHKADQAVAASEVAVDVAKEMDALAIERNDYRRERAAHVVTTMFEKFDEGFRRFAELYDQNRDAAEALAERFPYLKIALAEVGDDETSSATNEE